MGYTKSAGGAAAAAAASRAATARYLALVQEFPLLPIRSEEELDAATERLLQLDRRTDLDEGEQGYAEVLGSLIHAYERAHHPIPSAPDVDVLRMLIDSNGYSQSEVARGAGVAVSTVSQILSGKRTMGRKHIEAFARFFRVPSSVFFDGCDEEAAGERARTPPGA